MITKKKNTKILLGIYSVALTLLLVTSIPSFSAGSTISATLHYSSTLMDIGQSQVLSVNVTGGVPPYSYQWYINGNLMGISSSTYKYQPASTGNYTFYVQVTTISSASRNNTFTYIPTISGNLTVWVSIKDSANLTLNSSKVYFLVNTMPKPYIAPGNAIIVPVGEVSTFYGYVNGGTPPYSFVWYVNNQKFSNYSNFFNYTFQNVGKYTVYFVETDAVGYTSSSAIATVYATTSSLPSVEYSAMPQRNIVMNTNMTISVSAYTTYGVPEWVVDDNIVSVGINFTYQPTIYGEHVFYAEIPYDYSGVNVSVVGAFWSVNVTNVPYHIIISSERYADAGNYIYININSNLEGYPVTAYSVLRINGTYLHYTFVIYASQSNISIPVPANLTGGAVLYVYSEVSPNAYYALIHSNLVNLTINAPLSNLAIEYAVLREGSNYAVVKFSSSFVGGTSPFSYSWLINNRKFNSPSFDYNLTFGTYSITLTLTDSYGLSATNNTVLALVPPASTIERISGVHAYNGTFYINTSSLSVLVNTSSYQPVQGIKYVFFNYLNGNVSYISSGNVFSYVKSMVKENNGVKEYFYTYMFKLSIQKEGSYYIDLTTINSIGLYSNISFAVIYNTAAPVIGKILPATIYTRPIVHFYFNNITTQVPISEILVNASFPNGSTVYFPPFANATLPLPDVNGYYNISVTVVLVDGITASQNYRIYLDVRGVPFTASVVSYNGNEVTVSISPNILGSTTPEFYRVSTSPSFAGAQWQPFTRSFSVPVPNSQGTIYIQVKDSNGIVTTYSIAYSLPPPIYIQYLWLIVGMPLIIIVVIVLTAVVRGRKRKSIASKFGSVDLSSVEEAQKEKYFLEELAREGSPRTKEFKKLLKLKYNISDSDFEQVLKSLVDKKKVVVATDEEKKARIYKVVQETPPVGQGADLTPPPAQGAQNSQGTQGDQDQQGATDKK